MHKTVCLLGQGARGNELLLDQLHKLQIPTLLTWMYADALGEDDPIFCGRPGILGQRAANIILQKADEIHCFGARLDAETVGYNFDAFAPNGRVNVYDIDYPELAKFPDRVYTYRFDARKISLDGFIASSPEWLAWCKALYRCFRHELNGAPAKDGYIDPFSFINALSDAARPDDIFALGSSGFAPTSFMQAFRFNAGQQIRNCSTIGAMGADIPMAVGAAVANPGKRVICLTGDGGFTLNSPELETVRRLNLPITFFVYSNDGYASIRNMQKARFNGRLVGADPSSGFTLPPLGALADCYNLPYRRLYEHSYAKMLPDILRQGPQIIDVTIDPDWIQYPRVGSSMRQDGTYQADPLHDMTPHLDPTELQQILDWNGEQNE